MSARPLCHRCKLGQHEHHERERLGCTELLGKPPLDRVCGCVVGAVQPLSWSPLKFNIVPAAKSGAGGFVPRKTKRAGEDRLVSTTVRLPFGMLLDAQVVAADRCKRGRPNVSAVVEEALRRYLSEVA